MIRKMTVEDVSFFNEVRNDCRKALHDPSYYSLEESLSWFKKNQPRFFIYELKGEKIGYFRTSNWMPNGCYVGLDIHKKFRGKKMAVPAYNDFFNYLKKEIGKRNFYEFFLEVLSHNKIAISLYKKLGFQEISERGSTNKKMKLILNNE